MKTTREALVAARALIERPEAWTTRAFWRDAAGRAVGIPPSERVCFCVEGAIRHVTTGGDLDTDAEAALEALEIAAGQDAWDLNDYSDHAEVLAAFDRAIEAAS